MILWILVLKYRFFAFIMSVGHYKSEHKRGFTMLKDITKITLAYTHEPAHKGAPYTLDGEHFMNYGQLAQVLVDHRLTGQVRKPDHVPYDVDSDIPELSISVKSFRFTLTSKIKGNDMAEILATYSKNVASHTWAYAEIVGDELHTYFMDKAEFIEFCERFCELNTRNLLRGKRQRVAILNWLEERVA